MFGGETAGNVVRAGGDRATAGERQNSDGMPRGEEDDIPCSRVHAPKIDELQVLQMPCVITRLQSRSSGGQSDCTQSVVDVTEMRLRCPYLESCSPKPDIVGGNDIVRCNFWRSV